MFLLSSRARARSRAKRLFAGKKQVTVDVDTVLVCINGLKAAYLHSPSLTRAKSFRVGLNFSPEQLLAKIIEGKELILNEETPERNRYAPKGWTTTLEGWFWKDNGEELHWPTYMGELLSETENYLNLLRDQYEISGKAVAGYYLEQMYYPLCDIISLTETFFAEVSH